MKEKIRKFLPFRRIQRITGYLTTPGRENAGKKAEIKDRVKHQRLRKKAMKRRFKMISFLKIAFPALMVIGALGSLVVNIISKGDKATSLQWIGASLLYTALLFRNK